MWNIDTLIAFLISWIFLGNFFHDKYEVWPQIFWYSKSHPNSITNVCRSDIENFFSSRLQIVVVICVWHVFAPYLVCIHPLFDSHCWPFIWFIFAPYLVQINTICGAIITLALCLAPLYIIPSTLPRCQTIFIHHRWKDNRWIKLSVW